MRRLVYDVAVSLDGYIAGPDEDLSGFLYEGDHVAAYQQRLGGYDTVVMGRMTYEAGYAFGMKRGDKPYPHMEHHVLSRTLVLPSDSQVRVERGDALTVVDRLKAARGGDIYLCGGGRLAGFLLKTRRLDRLILKLNPILLHAGVKLFEEAAPARLSLTDSHQHDSGVVLLSYDVGYG